MESSIPPSVRGFISRYIVSIEELEVLLLLERERDREWTAMEINRQLRSQESSIRKWLEALVSLGLATHSGDQFKFGPVSEELGNNVTGLVNAYRERPIKVIEIIFSRPNENLLNFVRAFDLRNKP